MNAEHSTLDGINQVKTLPSYVKDELGQSACAITDHGTVSGTYRFYKSCKETGIKPILGMEAYYSIQDRTIRGKDEMGKNYHHMVLLALNNTGLHNLYKLSTEAYTTGMYYKPRIDDALIAEYSEGLAATSACLGSHTSQLIMRGEKEQAEKVITHHARMFPGKFFIEVQLHEGDQEEVNKVLIDIAKRHDLPLILTADCHYTRQEDKGLHEETLCMQTSARMNWPAYNHESKDNNSKGPTRFSFGDIDVHVAHHDWLWKRAQAYGIPYEAISNTMAFEAMVDDSSYFSDRRNRYPSFQGLPDDLPSWTVLERIATKGLAARMGGTPPKNYTDRLTHELLVIKRMGFYDYLLIVQEFMNGARELDILIGPGRGSVAGSLVAWALRITEVDPIKYGLLFSRWLNPGRAARPLLLNPSMIKQIEELPNGHKSNCISCSDGILLCGTHGPSRRSVRSPTIQSLVGSKPQGLGKNLLRCFNQGLSI